MKAYLVGYPGSQKIVEASAYLAKKYLPPSIETIYLNYTGPIISWARSLSNFFSLLREEALIFALDDYLISAPMMAGDYLNALIEMSDRPEVGCMKLCYASDEEHLDYPITTQWAVWRRAFLIECLNGVDTPWRFETANSHIYKLNLLSSKSIQRPCLPYFTNSSISSRWQGVNVEGLNDVDRERVAKFLKSQL